MAIRRKRSKSGLGPIAVGSRNCGVGPQFTAIHRNCRGGVGGEHKPIGGEPSPRCRGWYQIIKKRAARMARFFKARQVPTNAWLGVSVEDKKYGVPRIDHLRKVPARIRFLSVDPQLLSGPKGPPLFALYFAVTNPSPKALGLAKRGASRHPEQAEMIGYRTAACRFTCRFVDKLGVATCVGESLPKEGGL